MQTYETKLSAWSDVVEATYKVPAAPTFEPASGATVDFGAKLTLTCDDEDAWILYTTDGTEPSVRGAGLGAVRPLCPVPPGER